MQYNVRTSSEYLEALEEDWRKENLLLIRKMILEAKPDLVEGIEYKMLSYGNGKEALFHLNAQKNYVSLYVGDASKIDSSGALLQGINRGKGCLRFSKSVRPDRTRINEFIKKAIDLWMDGKDIGC